MSVTSDLKKFKASKYDWSGYYDHSKRASYWAIKKAEEDENRRKAEIARAESNRSEFAPSDSRKNLGFWGKAGLYGKAWITDPGQMSQIAFDPDERLDRVQRGGVVVPQRRKDVSSWDAGDKSTQVDHKIPLALGGKSHSNNLQLLDKRENEAKGKVEYWLVKKLNNKEINRKQAQDMALKWRDHVKDVPDAKKLLEGYTPKELTKEQKEVFEYFQGKNSKKFGNILDVAAKNPEMVKQAIKEAPKRGTKMVGDFGKQIGKSVITGGMDSVAEKLTDLTTGDDEANRLLEESQKDDDMSTSLVKKASEARAAGNEVKAQRYEKLSKSYAESAKQKNKGVGEFVKSTYGENDLDYYKKVGAIGGEFAINSGDVITDVMSFGGKAALKGALKVAAKEIIEESGEKATKKMINALVRDGGEKLLSRTAVNLGEDTTWKVGKKALAQQMLKNQGKGFVKDITGEMAKNPFKQALGQGLYYGGTSSLLNSTYEDKDFEGAMKSLPGDVAMNTAIQMVPAAAISALGKTGAKKVTNSAKNAASGGGTTSRKEILSALKEKGIPVKDYAGKTNKELRELLLNPDMDPMAARLANGDNPEAFGKDFFHNTFEEGPQGFEIKTDRPLREFDKAGNVIGERPGYTKLETGQIMLNDEAARLKFPDRPGSVVPSTRGEGAAGFMLDHERVHAEFGQPKGWDKARTENATNAIALERKFKAKEISEEEFVEGMNLLSKKGSNQADIDELRGGLRQNRWDEANSEANFAGVDDGMSVRKADIEKQLQDEGLWDDDYDAPALWARNEGHPLVKEYYDIDAEMSPGTSSFGIYDELNKSSVPVNNRIVNDVIPENTDASSAMLDAKADAGTELMSKQELTDKFIEDNDLAAEAAKSNITSRADGSATPQEIVALKQAGYADKEINDIRWPDRVNSDTLQMTHPDYDEPVTTRHMELATGDEATKVDQNVLHDEISDSLAREAEELEDIDVDAQDFEYKKLGGVQKFLARKKGASQVATSMETVLASNGPKGQRGVKIVKDAHSAQVRLEAEVLPEVKYFADNPDIAARAEKEAAEFDMRGGDISEDGLLYRSVFERIRNMRNAAGAKVKYLYDYIPKILDPDKKVDLRNWIHDNRDVEIMVSRKGKQEASTIGNEFSDILDIGEVIKKGEVDPKKAKAFSEFERSKLDNLPPELREQYESFFVSDPAEKLLRYMESNSKAYGQDVALKDYQLKADKINAERKAKKINGPKQTAMELYLDDLEVSARGANNDSDAGVRARAYFKKVWDKEMNPTTNAGLQKLRALQVLTKMQLAGFTNSTQSVNTAGLNGVGHTSKALYEMKKTIGNPEYLAELTDRAATYGMNLSPLADDLGMKMGKEEIERVILGKKIKYKEGWLEKGADWLLTVNQFKKVERTNRLAAMMATEFKLQKISDKVNAGGMPTKSEGMYLQLLGLSPEEIAMKGIDDDMFARGVNKGVSLTQFETSPINLPEIMTNGTFMDGVMTLQKFNVKQGEYLKEVIGKQALGGNFGPALNYLVSAVPAGAANQWVKGTGVIGLASLASMAMGLGPIQKKEPETSWKEAATNPLDAAKLVAEKASYSGGFGYADSVWQNWKYKKNLMDFGLKSTGPIGSDVAAVLDVGDKALGAIEGKGSWGDVGQDALAEVGKRLPVPFFSGAIKQAIKPYNPGNAAYYELQNKVGKLNARNADQKEFADKHRSGQDVSETRVASTLVKKLYDPETGNILKYVSDKKKAAILKAINDAGIDKYKALNYGKQRELETRKYRNYLSSEEKAIADMSASDASDYMNQNGYEYNDFPALVDYLKKKGVFEEY